MKYIFLIFLISASASLAGIAITIYSDGFALVKDARELSFDKGTISYDFSPVPSGINPQTVHFKADGITVLEQNYEYDIVSTARLLEKNIDKQIKITMSEAGEVFEGKLLSADGSSILIDNGNQLVTLRMDEVLNVIFLERPNRFYTKPTLAWSLYSGKSGKRKTELSYMTNNIGWDAAYVATVNKDDTRLTLDGWVTIDNRSGMSYENATLKLVAGQVHRVEQPTPRRAKGVMAMDYAEAAPSGFQEEAFFEYHLYTLPRPATIADRQQKQLSLFEPAETEAKKKLIYEPNRGNVVRVEMEFKNSEEKGLGMPLPEGIIRVYKQDQSGALQFVGEDRIKHTPKDEEVRVYLGNAFDVVAERTQKDYRRISDRVSEQDYEIKLRNHKKEDITVKVVEHFWGDWFIKSENIKGTKKDATTYEWEVPVPKDGETILIFTVRNK